MTKENIYRSRIVQIGPLRIGGDEPVRVQSMTNTPTHNVEATYRQVMQLYEAGCELVRMSVRNMNEVDRLGDVRQRMENAGVNIPLAADIHFSPGLAEAAAAMVHKVRINPGNFLDRQYYLSKGKRQEKFSAEEREQEVMRLVENCRQYGTAIRVGVNHGSLSERILNKFGNTTTGMVASAMEFLDICRKNDFHELIVSMKSSHVPTMVRANLELAETMQQAGMDYPFHLGVTEAGEGAEGRIRSAAGIGPLLAAGLGDTLRVSLTEDPVAEIPVARALAQIYAKLQNKHYLLGELRNRIKVSRSRSGGAGILGGKHPIAVAGQPAGEQTGERQPDLVPHSDTWLEDRQGIKYCARQPDQTSKKGCDKPSDDCHQMNLIQVVNGDLIHAIGQIRKIDKALPLLIRLDYEENDPQRSLLRAAGDLSFLVLSAYGDGYWLNIKHPGSLEATGIVFEVLQVTGKRISGTAYISCPGCGRTDFHLQDTLRKIKVQTRDMKNIKIAVMGCIVNGPGEMADADYGYVGEGGGRVSLYYRGSRLKQHIPEEDAVAELLALIRAKDGSP